MLIGGTGNDTLKGGAGADIISGGDGTDTILGNAQNDTISGGAGNDIITGGDGDDVITIDSGTDKVKDLGGSTGNDQDVVVINGSAILDAVDIIGFTATSDTKNNASNANNAVLKAKDGQDVTINVSAATGTSKAFKLVGGTNLFRLYLTPNANVAQGFLAKKFIWSRIFSYSENFLSEIIDDLPKTFQSPTMAPFCEDNEKYKVVDELVSKIEEIKENKDKIDGQEIEDVLTVNGVRFSFKDGSWGLIRASSNKPSLVVVTESPTSDDRKKKIFDFIDQLLQKTGKIGEYDQKV